MLKSEVKGGLDKYAPVVALLHNQKAETVYLSENTDLQLSELLVKFNIKQPQIDFFIKECIEKM